MCNDDSRGNESSDRQNASNKSSRGTILERLETIDRITRTLLADCRAPSRTPLETVDPSTRRAVRRQILEIRAKTSQLGVLLDGSAAATPYYSTARTAVVRTTPCVTTYSGPAPEAFERERHREHDRAIDGPVDSDNRDDSKDRDDTDADGGDADE